jgi:hypothetical protein
MLKFMSGLFLGAVLLGIVVHVSRGQVATTDLQTKGIHQGDNVSMIVSLDRPSNVAGVLTVHASSQDGGLFSLACNLTNGASGCGMTNRLPLDAKTGKWSIKKITFQNVFASNSEKELTINGEMSFTVAAHGEIMYPQSATVSSIH